MTMISISELKANAGKYVNQAADGDIFITRNGNVVAKLTAARPGKLEAVQSLFGILPSDIDLDKEREERFMK